MLLSKKQLKHIVRKALIENFLQEYVQIEPSGTDIHMHSIDPSASSVKSTTMKHVLAQAVTHFRMAKTFLDDSQKHLKRGNAVYHWNESLLPFERGLIAILDSRFKPFIKGVDETNEKKFNVLMGDAESMYDLADSLGVASIEELEEFLYAFEAALESTEVSSEEIMKKLAGVTPIQREQINFLIRDMLKGDKVITNFKSMTPEQVEARMGMADAAKLRADIEDKRMQILRQKAAGKTQRSSTTGSIGATPAQGIRKPKP
jgi:hypothetical protein